MHSQKCVDNFADGRFKSRQFAARNCNPLGVCEPNTLHIKQREINILDGLINESR